MGELFLLKNELKLQDEQSSLGNLKLFAELEVVLEVMIEAGVDVSSMSGASGAHRPALRRRRRRRVIES